MIESIHIKNLGPIKNIHIEHIKPFTVLIGESGSGKSTLMKAIALFRWIYKMHNIRSYLKRSNISKSPFEFKMREYIKNCGFEQFVKPDTEIIYTTSFQSGKTYEIKFVKNKLSGVANNELINDDSIYFNKISFISETRNVIPLWADKGASLTGDLGFYFTEVYRDFELASEAMKELEVSFLDLKFVVNKTKSKKEYTIQSKSNEIFEIDFKNSSSGTQTSIPISLIAQYFSTKFNFEDAFNRSVLLRYLAKTDTLTNFKPIKNLGELNKKIFIHIEEPELSLFPNAQCQLINDLVNKCFISNDNSIELFLSTHSPYIINHLNLLIKAFDKNSMIDGAKINYDDLAVYQVAEGMLVNLIVQNERLVNTNPLSDTINNIYDQYNALG